MYQIFDNLICHARLSDTYYTKGMQATQALVKGINAILTMPPPESLSSAEKTFPPQRGQFSSGLPVIQVVSIAANVGFTFCAAFCTVPPLRETIGILALKVGHPMLLFLSFSGIGTNNFRLENL